MRELVREALLDTVVVSGLEYVGEVLEEERTELCGVRYRHDPERRASRAGSMPSSSTLGGRRVQVERPRVRSREGHELTLPSWRAWSARDPLEQRALEQMVLGSPRAVIRAGPDLLVAAQNISARRKFGSLRKSAGCY